MMSVRQALVKSWKEESNHMYFSKAGLLTEEELTKEANGREVKMWGKNVFT